MPGVHINRHFQKGIVQKTGTKSSVVFWLSSSKQSRCRETHRCQAKGKTRKRNTRPGCANMSPRSPSMYPLGSSQRGVEHTWNVTARCAGGSIPVMEVKEKVEGEKEELV